MSEIEGYFNFDGVYDDAVAKAPRGSTLVEVGVFKGKSLLYLRKKAEESGKDLFLVGVDHGLGPVGVDRTAGYSITQGPTANDLAVNCYGTPIILSDSDKAARLFADGSCFFVFIDACHDYEFVKRDIIAWLPKVSSGGILAGHDYGDSFPGVKQAVGELLDMSRVAIHTASGSWLYSVQ